MPNHPHQLYSSPLRYPGGKRKVANFMKLLFLCNDLVGQPYAELYAGGASVALALLYEEFASHIHINDLNKSIFTFWYIVLNDTDALCRLITNTDVSMEEWNRQRWVQHDNSATPVELAFSTFFLNRTNRSGIINGGVIGGREQQGEWKLNARYNKAALVQRIEKVARYRNRITLTQHDAAYYIRTVLPLLPQRLLLYLDPPYYVKGAGLYQHFYQHCNHVEIAGLVADINQQWVVSYDAEEEIENLYSQFDRLNYDLSYSAATRCLGKEVMFFSPDLKRPDITSPANIKPKIVHAMQASVADVQACFDLAQ